MPNLLSDTIEANTWAREAIARHIGGIYGELVPGVIWTDARAEDGSLLVEADPRLLVHLLEREPLPLMQGHDPGRPIGHVLEAALFQAPHGEQFVAAILGYYTRDQTRTFADLGLTNISAPPIVELPAPPSDLRIEIATDPREVSPEWVSSIAASAPLSVTKTSLSHNSSETLQELIRIGLPYILLVWNPLVKAFCTELGKAAYAGLYTWLKGVIASASKHKAPLVCIECVQQDCHVSFLIRGNDVSLNYAAHEALSAAAVHAAKLIEVLAHRGMPPSKLVYEFDTKALRWFPSYAVLGNKRIIANSPMLISAASDLPAGLSLGLSRKDMGRGKQVQN